MNEMNQTNSFINLYFLQCINRFYLNWNTHRRPTLQQILTGMESSNTRFEPSRWHTFLSTCNV